ncbi:MAG TPA: anaerobic ribonucleoside-triphosphate reductase [Thiobacillus sp.]
MNDMSVSTQIQTIELKDEERTRCEVWTRVMGYHRPTTSFNKGKQSEHRERQFFVEGRCRMG